jgi:vanillate O-demethylase monooxygenase subunit
VLEAQQRAMDENPDRVFYNLNVDTGAMWARRLIDRMIAREHPLPTLQAAE